MVEHQETVSRTSSTVSVSVRAEPSDMNRPLQDSHLQGVRVEASQAQSGSSACIGSETELGKKGASVVPLESIRSSEHHDTGLIPALGLQCTNDSTDVRFLFSRNPNISVLSSSIISHRLNLLSPFRLLYPVASLPRM